jgi:deazaflavin-dependent oxidoreductase (nitroreductase family)
MTDETKPERDYSLFGDDHIRIYRETNGEVGHIWNGVPCLILTTRRKHGEIREVPLIYGKHGDDVLIVPSKGGAPEAPYWYKDLVRTPEVTVQIEGDVFQAVARTASHREKAPLWQIMTGIWPDYDDYQARTEREIPIVVLERS